MEIGGGGASSIRFALKSIHADVRRDVLSVVMGQIQEPWAPALLLEIFADPDAGVRGEAFEFLQKRTRARRPRRWPRRSPGATPISSSRRSRCWPSAASRARASCWRRRSPTRPSRSASPRWTLLADEASAAMEPRTPTCASAPLRPAPSSATRRALAPLLGLVTEREPELAEKREGLDRSRGARAPRPRRLGSPEAQASIAALATHRTKRIAGAAVEALGGVAQASGDLAPLKAALASSDADLKRDAALGLSAAADPAGLPILKGLVTASGALALRGLAASIALGEKPPISSWPTSITPRSASATGPSWR